MTSDLKTIRVTAETNLGSLLTEASDLPVLLEANGVVYRLSRESENSWAGYDPERVRAGLRKFAGMISPEDAKRLKEAICRGREEGTRLLGRP